jgi:hypothetical protein
VSARLGRGAWLRVREEADGRIAFMAWFASLNRPATEGQTDARVSDLAALLLAGPLHVTKLGELGEPGGSGTRWCAESEGLCVAECPNLLGVTNRGESLAALGCPEPAAPLHDEPWLTVEVSSMGKPGPLFHGSISPQGGRLHWAEQ